MALNYRATFVTVKRWLIGVLLLLPTSSVFGQQYDVLIRGGRVVDGAGNPWVYADLSFGRKAL